MEYPTSHMYFLVYTQAFRHFLCHHINVTYLLQWNPDFFIITGSKFLLPCQKNLVEIYAQGRSHQLFLHILTAHKIHMPPHASSVRT